MGEDVKLINMTAHPIKLWRKNGKSLTIAPSGRVARVDKHEQEIGEVRGVALFKTKLADLDLPAEQPNVFYIVSAMAKYRGDILGRTDLLVPCKMKRNDNKMVIGARGLTL